MHEFKVNELVHEFVRHGQTLAVGSSGIGLTFIKKLVQKILEEEIQVKMIPTSVKQAELLHELEMPLTSLNDGLPELVFEFADRADRHLNFVKTDTTSLVRDKMLAKTAKQLIVLCHAENIVKRLNGWIPFEASEFGLKLTEAELMNLGEPRIRKKNNKLFKTETNNCLIDVNVNEAYNLADINWIALNIPGIIETGLFLDEANELIFFDGKAPGKIVRLKALY